MALKRPSTLTKTVQASRADYEMYNRYVAYFHSGTSPYGGTAPITFTAWYALKPQHRPGGPA